MDSFVPRTYDLIEHTIADHARTVLIDWMLGNHCSYACSYCPNELHDGTVHWQTAKTVLSLYDALHSHYVQHRGKKVWLQFTGGEPTMHPHIIRLLEEASAREFSVSLISNASRTIRFWHKIAPYLDNAILTYHNEFAEIDHFVGVGEIVTERMPVHINVTMHPDRFDRTYEEALALRAALPTATISLKPLRLGFQTELFNYSAEQLRTLKDGVPRGDIFEGATPRGSMTVTTAGSESEIRTANGFVVHGENRWSGYRCNAGLESLRVKGDGSITRAVCTVGGRIGRLGEEIELPAMPIICTAEVCGCTSDILITKARRSVRNV